jgi:hypothetical protein
MMVIGPSTKMGFLVVPMMKSIIFEHHLSEDGTEKDGVNIWVHGYNTIYMDHTSITTASRDIGLSCSVMIGSARPREREREGAEAPNPSYYK